ncbi:hypothetical protein GCM10008164_55240 [Achromobacter xylosoxidans]|nr:hypothetical protein GCM10008164_55240 [Achromobacter xylosoxidans]
MPVDGVESFVHTVVGDRERIGASADGTGPGLPASMRAACGLVTGLALAVGFGGDAALIDSSVEFKARDGLARGIEDAVAACIV